MINGCALRGVQVLANNIITEEMEVYTAEEVANLVDEGDAETDSDSEIDEDPDFPLPKRHKKTHGWRSLLLGIRFLNLSFENTWTKP